MMDFRSFSGKVIMINDFFVMQNDPDMGCFKLFTVDNGNGAVVNFVVEPTTYFVNHVNVKVGDQVTGFYDINVPVPLIYPPQYRAVVMAKEQRDEFVAVSFFNQQLVSSDGSLQLNINARTPILLENGQTFSGSPVNRNLIVVYSATTRSIPAQTTPKQIIVMC
ncbi:hypothetical protein H9649_14655 [Sporosarcina sp. Sa2YVA2]|uniref:Uncharacterized protein n=1 Tax=Sporosarcina quadrami TaxID=2762234 RepID=A0ABR8UDP0_9BACL|nr:hypothetical protein [Sporosarcina quadrami]MBD7985828.1 hypothetical protein [Sporosarcina quadrami]